MKILLTTDTYEPTINGVVTSVKNLYTQLKDYGHDVRILTLSHDFQSRKEGDVYYIRSFNAGKIYPDARGTIPHENIFIEEILEWKPEIIHTNSEFFTFIYANQIAHELSIPTVHTYHTMYEYYTGYVFKFVKVGKRTVSTIIRRILKNVDGIIAPTKKVKESLESYGLNNNIRIIPTGISLDRFVNRATEEEISQLKKRHNIPQNKKIIMTVGRLGVEKNIDEVIENFKLIQQNAIDTALVIVGDGPHRSALEEEVRVNGLEDSVIFTGMAMPDEISKYYQMGDIFASASNSETQGLTYIEALASGRPVLCKYDEVLEGIVENGVNGYTYERSEDFIKYMNDILKDDAKYKQMSLAAKESVERYSLENFGKNVEILYQELIENHSGERNLMYVPLIMAKKVARGMKRQFRVQKEQFENLKITK